MQFSEGIEFTWEAWSWEARELIALNLAVRLKAPSLYFISKGLFYVLLGRVWFWQWMRPLNTEWKTLMFTVVICNAAVIRFFIIVCCFNLLHCFFPHWLCLSCLNSEDGLLLPVAKRRSCSSLVTISRQIICHQRRLDELTHHQWRVEDSCLIINDD